MATQGPGGECTDIQGAEDDYSPHAIQMLRTVQNNTLLLSQMADQKASILMGATFLVFSISVSQSLQEELPWALAILGVFAFASSLCAVLAVIPSVRKPPEGVRPNPMFFGHFSDLEEDEWTHDILSQMHADEGVFRIMLHDIYQNGQVLKRKKYRFLGLAYQIFVTGLFVTLAVFGLELFLTY